MSDVYELLDGLRTVVNDQKYADRLEQLRALEVSAKEKLDDAQTKQGEASAAYAKALDAQSEQARLHNEVKQKLEPQLKTVADAAKVNQELLTQLNARETSVAAREQEYQGESARRKSELDDDELHVQRRPLLRHRDSRR